MNTNSKKELEESLLGRLIPKEPTRHYKVTATMDDFTCSVCGKFVGCYYPSEKRLYANNYCALCGQAMDWTDVKKEIEI